MKHNKYVIFAITTAIVVGTTIFALGNKNYFKFNAAEKTDWKHYSAVMPTLTEQGIREYWIDCASERTPHFTKPEGVTAVDYNLTDTQIEEIKADPKDERIIPTLTRIQTAVTKNVDGTSAYDLTFVNDAYGYTYLDSVTKATISDANEESITNAYTTFYKYFTVVYDAGRDLMPIIDKQAGLTIERGYDATYGDVLNVTTTQGSGGKTSQVYFYGLSRNGVTYGPKDVLNFSVYSPFPNAAYTSQTYWVGAYGTATQFTATPSNWTSISSTGTRLNSDGKCATAFTQAISLQRYVNGTVDPYSGTYKVTSIVAEKELTEEGSTVIRGSNNISDVHTWGASVSNVNITFDVNTKYGKATQVDIKSKTDVLELKWDNATYDKLTNFDYARMYVYAKTTQRVFVSLTSWRNNVVSLPNVEPFAKDNGSKATTVQNLANVVADQWNVIDIPSAFFKQDTDNSFFIEVWADKNEAKDGWLFTDFFGHNSNAILDNGGQLITHSASLASVSPTYDADIGACSSVTMTSSARCYAKQNRNIDISEFTSIEFKVKNLASSSMKIWLYMIASGIYGHEVKGSYYVQTIASGSVITCTISVSEYFGSYAGTSSIMFAFDGAANNNALVSSIIGVLPQSGHKHVYGEFITGKAATCEANGVIGHYHCNECGKDFDENKNELATIVIAALGHTYIDKGENYECSTCHKELMKAEELVVKKEKETKQYIFLGSSICNGYHGAGVKEHTSMADFFAEDYLLASYTGLSNGQQVSQKDAYLRRIENKGTVGEPYLGVYSFDYDQIELKTSGVGIFNGKEFSYSVTDGRIVIDGPASYLYKFNAVFYGKDNVIKKAQDGFSLSDKQPRWATPEYEVTDRHSYVGLMEELLATQSELKVDEFVLQLSTNDLGLYIDQQCTTHLPLGEVTPDDVKDSSKFDTDTSFGALEWIVAKAKEVWGCKVTIFTCQMYDADYATYKSNGYNLESLKNTGYYKMYQPTLEVARKWDTGLIDIYANKDAEIQLNENKARYKADAVHLTEIGYEAVMYPIFRRFFDK